MTGLLYKIKECTECGKLKPLTEFHKDSRKKDGRRSRCKECRVVENSSFYRKHRADKYKDFNKKKFLEMHSNQEHKCLICGNIEYLVIDHSHKHGTVRGLLCQNCNKGLGFFLDNPVRLVKAIIYILKNNLKKFKKSSDFVMNFRNFFVSL